MIFQMTSNFSAIVACCVVIFGAILGVTIFVVNHYWSFRCPDCGCRKMNALEAGVVVYCCGCGIQYTVEQIHEEIHNVE